MEDDKLSLFLERLRIKAKTYITHPSSDIRELAFASIEYVKVMEKMFKSE